MPKSEHQQGLAKTIFRNTAFVTVGGLLLKGLTFLFNVYVIRYLGDSRFGQYSIVLGFVGLFSIFAELGITQYAMRTIAQDRRKASELLSNLIVLRLILGVTGILGISAAGFVFGYPSQIILGIFIYTTTFLLAAFLDPFIAVLTAFERFDRVTGVTILGRLLFMLFGAGFLFLGGSYVWLVVASLVQMPFQIGLAWWSLRDEDEFHFEWEVEAREWPSLLKAGMPFEIISLMLTIASGIDTVMLSKWEPDKVVGWYNASYNLVISLTFLFYGFKTAIVPSLTRTFAEDPETVERWYHNSTRFIFYLSIPIAVGGMLVAYPLIRFLYTDQFLPSGLALQILVWDVPLLMYSAFCGNMTTVISEERAAARIYSINTLANVGLNLYAIPRYGLVGAALVTLVTDFIGTLQFFFFLRRLLHQPSIGWFLARVTITSLLMGGIVWMFGGANLFLKIGVGVVVFVALSFPMKLLDERERVVLWDLLRRVPDLFRSSQPAN